MHKDIGALAETNRLHLADWATGDSGVAQNGVHLDTQAQLADADTNYQSKRTGQIVVDVNATLTVANTLALVGTLQHSPDDGAGSPSGFVNVPAGTLLGTAHLGTGDITALAIGTVLQAAPSVKFVLGPIDLTRLERHVRLVVTPTFTNAADTAVVAVHVITGGSSIRPVDALAG